MLRRADEVDIYVGEILGFIVITKKVARKLLKKHGSKVTLREVEEFGMLFIAPVPL